MHEAEKRNRIFHFHEGTTDCIGLHEDAMEQMEIEKKNTEMAGCMFNPGRSPSLECVLESDLASLSLAAVRFARDSFCFFPMATGG
jgi:hypothetical protein